MTVHNSQHVKLQIGQKHSVFLLWTKITFNKKSPLLSRQNAFLMVQTLRATRDLKHKKAAHCNRAIHSSSWRNHLIIGHHMMSDLSAFTAHYQVPRAGGISLSSLDGCCEHCMMGFQCLVFGLLMRSHIQGGKERPGIGPSSHLTVHLL